MCRDLVQVQYCLVYGTVLYRIVSYVCSVANVGVGGAEFIQDPNARESFLFG